MVITGKSIDRRTFLYGTGAALALPMLDAMTPAFATGAARPTPLGFFSAGDHPRACTAWLTGTHAKMTAGADLHAGVSADQIAAREFGKETQLASIEVSLESSEVMGSCEAAYSCAYYNTISWRDENTPNPMENRPRALFERLFGTA